MTKALGHHGRRRPAPLLSRLPARSAESARGGRVNGAWEHREQLAVALVLRDKGAPGRHGYTPKEAAASLGDRMAHPRPANVGDWLDAIRTEVDG